MARTACSAAADLTGSDPAPFSVSINVSARQLGDPGLIGMLEAALRDAGCPASALVVEITETALMDDLEAAVRALDAIKALGVRLDLDDFGTGYSSLIYLKRFPVDRIKIDQTFVAGLGSNHADTIIVASTIALAHAVGIQAIAEGVETLEQLEVLRRMGCDYMQGYLLSRPLDADALTRWLATCDVHTQALAGRGGAVGPLGTEFGPTTDAGHATGRARRSVADGRDRKADRRDALADRRDALADLRDRAADRREAAVRDREDAAVQRLAAEGGRSDTESEAERGT